MRRSGKRRKGGESDAGGLPPIVTLTTDFGLSDSYVAEMKGVLLSGCPAARIVDVTHAIAPQDILGASVVLERVLRVFEPGTIHVAVVDPGVGTKRRLILVEIDGQRVLCPDNGLITWAWKRAIGKATARELIWRPKAEAGGVASATFHGRDILAPVAARLACGEAVEGMTLVKEIEPVLLPVEPAHAGSAKGEIIAIDHYGNAITNVAGVVKSIRVGRKVIAVRRTYADVKEGEAVALVGSSGLVEIAVRNGNAAERLELKVGMGVGVGLD